MNIIVIKHHETDSWNYTHPSFMAVAANEDAAKQWIQDEVDGKHSSTQRYMSGKNADWWILYGTFSLTSVEVQEKI